jgi:hypothetical protein
MKLGHNWPCYNAHAADNEHRHCKFCRERGALSPHCLGPSLPVFRSRLCGAGFLLNDRQFDVLHDACRMRYRNNGCRCGGGKRPPGERWFTPLDIGATNGSYHSATLTQLWKKGLVMRLKFGSCSYRADDKAMHFYLNETY